ncbi:MAG: hypothetical protein GY816_16120 [Cytophagales bacterium]|nr:hypothetical protein [Cytophagales bacterium]
MNTTSSKEKVTFYQYFSDTSIAQINYSTYQYSTTKSDSIVSFEDDSGYFYRKTPNIRILRYQSIRSDSSLFFLINILNKDGSVSKKTEIGTWDGVRKYKNTLIESDSFDIGYYPKME